MDVLPLTDFLSTSGWVAMTNRLSEHVALQIRDECSLTAKAKPIAEAYLDEVGRPKMNLSTKVLEKKANKPVEKTGKVLKKKEKAESPAKWASRGDGDVKETTKTLSPVLKVSTRINVLPKGDLPKSGRPLSAAAKWPTPALEDPRRNRWSKAREKPGPGGKSAADPRCTSLPKKMT